MKTETQDVTLITVKEACALLRVSLRTLRTMTSRNPPWLVRVHARCIRIDREALLRTLRSGKATERSM